MLTLAGIPIDYLHLTLERVTGMQSRREKKMPDTNDHDMK